MTDLPDRDGRPDDEIDDPPVPLSFKVMVALAVLYLGWRLIEGLLWLLDRLF